MSQAYTIGIIVFDGVLTSEVIGPAEVFAIASQSQDFQANVRLISLESQPTVRTDEGIRLGTDTTITDDLPLDVLIVPGGSDMTDLRQHAGLNAFIRQQETSAQWIGSVCAGAFVLGEAGVLDGKQATTWFGGETRLQEQFPAIHVVHDQPVVIDQRHITANGGLVSYRAALILLGRLSSPDHAHEVYQTLNLDRLGTWDDIAMTIAAA